jgi:FkbM family methyltransferase
MSVRIRWLTIQKGIYCAFRPSLWKFLLRGVTPTVEHGRALCRKALRTIVDVGANKGQFTLFARIHYPEAMIYSFEPLKEPAGIFAKLFEADKRVFLKSFAIGSDRDLREMHVTTSDDSSSLLPPNPAQEEIFDVQSNHTELVSVNRLADCLSPEALVSPALLKIDVQGLEVAVLEGSSELLHQFDWIYVECSYLALYEGQALVDDVIAWLRQRHFHLSGVFNQYIDPIHGPVQADFLFARATSEKLAADNRSPKD